MTVKCIDCGCERSLPLRKLRDHPRCKSCATKRKHATGAYSRPETIEKYRAAKVGKTYSPAHCLAISQGLRAAWATRSLSANLSPIEMRAYRKMRNDNGLSRSDSLRSIGREDLL